ncbi:hypothetical protein BC829DRAFT_92566 [Chytridium lagenaria]|nr:hypothetical protein BC829DRAFT_92566 [Chytridium lagenaria]
MSEDHNLLGVVRGLRVPLTVWLVGYSTLSMLPKAVRNPNLLTSYIPGMSITALARGELALEPLFVLSGVTAGLILEANTPADAHIPTTWSIARFWFRKLTSIVPAVLSCFGAVLVSRWTGSSVVKYSRFAHLFGTIMDAQFYLLAPWAFQYLHKSHRGAAPRLVIASSLASGTLAAITSLAFGLKVPKADGIPWAHAVTGIASTAAQVPFRFPAFMAGLALAVERHRKGSGPSNVNQIIGVGVSAALWVALLMTRRSWE